ncbi:MAG: hypothetical protein RIC55_12155 [Pirellulaceae bacterium]
METTRKRRWWQFGLRDAIWLVVVVSLLVNHWRDHNRLTHELMVTRFVDEEIADGDRFRINGVMYRIVRVDDAGD